MTELALVAYQNRRPPRLGRKTFADGGRTGTYGTCPRQGRFLRGNAAGTAFLRRALGDPRGLFQVSELLLFLAPHLRVVGEKDSAIPDTSPSQIRNFTTCVRYTVIQYNSITIQL
jgi:hypothetical protein